MTGPRRWMDLASVEVSEEYRGRGLFKRVIDQLEGLLADAGYEGLRVENVLTEQFASFLEPSRLCVC